MSAALQQQGAGLETVYAPQEVRSCWYHLIYGHDPDRGQEYILQPQTPDGDLRDQHIGHLKQILPSLEPGSQQAFAFSIANLSRNDTRHRAGHGGVALILSLRIANARDHANRPAPFFKYALVAVNRALDRTTLHLAALAFVHHVCDGSGSERYADGLYRRYLAESAEGGGRKRVLCEYAQSMHTLPPLHAAQEGSFEFVMAEQGSGKHPLDKTVYVEYAGEGLFEALGQAAQVAEILYRSRIPWVSIELGSVETRHPGGLTVRIVPAGQAPGSARGDREGSKRLVLADSDPTRGLGEVAARLFNAKLEQVSHGALLAPPPLMLPSNAPQEVTLREGLSPTLTPSDTGQQMVSDPAAGRPTVVSHLTSLPPDDPTRHIELVPSRQQNGESAQRARTELQDRRGGSKAAGNEPTKDAGKQPSASPAPPSGSEPSVSPKSTAIIPRGARDRRAGLRALQALWMILLACGAAASLYLVLADVTRSHRPGAPAAGTYSLPSNRVPVPDAVVHDMGAARIKPSLVPETSSIAATVGVQPQRRALPPESKATALTSQPNASTKAGHASEPRQGSIPKGSQQDGPIQESDGAPRER